MLANTSGDRGCGIERKFPGPGSMMFSNLLQLLMDSGSICVLEGFEGNDVGVCLLRHGGAGV